jgi:hypothetical protein
MSQTQHNATHHLTFHAFGDLVIKIHCPTKKFRYQGDQNLVAVAFELAHHRKPRPSRYEREWVI